MPTRAEILDTLAASQTQVMAFFQGLSPEDLERPATASEVPGEVPWRAKDHFAHLVKSERSIQQLLRRTLAGETRDVLLRLQYPAGMEMPDTPRSLCRGFSAHTELCAGCPPELLRQGRRSFTCRGRRCRK